MEQNNLLLNQHNDPTPGGTKPDAHANVLKWFSYSWKNKPLFSTVCALLVMVILQTIALGFDFPTFGDWLSTWFRNWINLLRNNAGIGIVALGMTFVILSGGIDLSVGSTYVATGAIMMVFANSNENGLLMSLGLNEVVIVIIAIAVGMIAGMLMGEGTGLLITKSKLPPFIATLGMMKILRSVTQQCMTGGVAPKVPAAFKAISSTLIGGQIVLPIFYWLLIAAALYAVSKYTAFGRQVFAVGSNERTSRLSGINVDSVKRRVYALTSVLVAFAAVINISRIGSMDYANAGSGYEMDAIAAVIVGGTSMSGGKGSVLGTVLGMLIIAVMNNLLNLLGVPPFLREAFKGVIVIGAVMLQKKEATN